MGENSAKLYQLKGTDTPWYRGRDLTDAERDRFRLNTLRSQAEKSKAMRGHYAHLAHPIPVPRLRVESLLPQVTPNGFRSLSLFSGGGGLDIGFDRSGFDHVASYDLLESAGTTLRLAKPAWAVFSGAQGDVCQISWEKYRGEVDVIHGGPPCQPFSHAGRRSGAEDVRDMFPEFVRAVLEVKPRAFVAENVTGLATSRFRQYIQATIFGPLSGSYQIQMFTLEAASFGVPQRRKRVFFVGFRRKADAHRFNKPEATHGFEADNAEWFPGTAEGKERTMGAREALGLPDIGYDNLAPTIRSGLTGPRHTTSVLNSVTSQRQWSALGIWPNGVGETRAAAAMFPAEGGHYRLSIPDCMLLQGFPEDWPIAPPVYKALGLIGNSVSPPMGYRVALAVARSLGAAWRPASL